MQQFSKSGCAVVLVTCPVLIVAIDRYLPPETGDAHIWFSIASGVLLASGLSGLWLLLTGQVETGVVLMQRSEGAQPPADGDAVVATGRVRATPPLLTAPLSGTRCVAYFYRMYRLETRGGDSAGTEQLPVYWGYASRPLVVDTPSRSIAVAAPQLSVPRTAYSGDDEAVQRAREYIGTVTWEPRRPQLFFAGDPALQWMNDIIADEEGSARRDWKSGEQLDPATLLLEELVLMDNAEVTVHGRWSARRNAITLEEGGHVPATLTLGPPTAVGLAARGAPSLVASWIGTLITFALGVGLIWFAAKVWPQLK